MCTLAGNIVRGPNWAGSQGSSTSASNAGIRLVLQTGTATPGKLLCGVLLSTYSPVYLFTLVLVICSLVHV